MRKDFRGVFYFNGIALILLSLIGLYNYLFFHMIIELSTVFLGIFIYIIASYSSKYSHDNNFLFIGIGYLFVGLFDMFHVLAYEDVGVFDFSISVSIRFWIGARFMESFILFYAFHKLLKLKSIDVKKVFASFLVISFIMLTLIYFNPYFPKLYFPETGFTTYKRVIDVLIIIMFLLALYVVKKNETRVLNRKTIIIAIVLKILSQILFLISSENEEVFELLSHVFKYLSYIALFTVFVRESLMRPYESIFVAFKEKEKQLLETSKRDSLTGLYNHSTSYEIIREIIKKNKETKNYLCLMMIDVDDFKHINDKYGHVKGDQILYQIGQLFKNFEGPLKLAGRYGGDEFVVLFDDCDKDRAGIISNRIFEKMAELSIAVGFNVTLSIGISEWEKGFTAKDLVKSADLQMYKSKSVGKNTYSIFAKSE